MKRTFLVIAVFAILVSCNRTQKNESKDESTDPKSKVEKPSAVVPKQNKLFGIEAAYVKYQNNVAGQELIREWWFDQYGNRQYEEYYGDIMGQKTGSKSLVLDGYKYNWDFDDESGTKSRFYHATTNYDEVSDEDIKKYGIQKHGYEEIMGKKCLKVTTEKPVKSTSWVWNNIPLRTEAVYAGNNMIMEVIEISTSNIDEKIFEMPEGITFSE